MIRLTWEVKLFAIIFQRSGNFHFSGPKFRWPFMLTCDRRFLRDFPTSNMSLWHLRLFSHNTVSFVAFTWTSKNVYLYSHGCLYIDWASAWLETYVSEAIIIKFGFHANMNGPIAFRCERNRKLLWWSGHVLRF